jgi:hypothetical protein
LSKSKMESSKSWGHFKGEKKNRKRKTYKNQSN